MSEQSSRARNWGKILLFSVLALGVVLVAGRALASFYVEVLWFRSVDYSSVFWTRTLAEGGMRVLAGTITAVVAFLNFRVVAGTLSSIQIRRKFGNLEIAERIPRRTIFLGVLLGSLVLGLWLGASFPRGSGLRLLLSLNGSSWNLPVPPLGADASFFVFGLPVVSGVLLFGLALTALLFAFSVAAYAATGAIGVDDGKPSIKPLPRRHLALLGAVFLLLLAARFWIGPYLLLLDGNSGVQGIFGFSDAEARMPGYKALAFITAVSGFLVWWAAVRKRMVLVLASGGAVLLGGLVIVQLYPELVQRFRVEPNELERETPFIAENLRFTKIGFGLDRLERRDYNYSREEEVEWSVASGQFSGLPVWTQDALLTTYQSVEARYRYYDFEEVAIDRYRGPQGVEAVAVAVREVDPAGIEDPNWQNLHLRTLYLAGEGAVASAASRRTGEGRPPMYLYGIPPVFSQDPSTPPELQLTDPRVFFGSRPQLYAILNPEAVDAGQGDPSPADQSVSAADAGEVGRGRPAPRDVAGIPLSSLSRTLALAWTFRDPNLLFAAEVSDASRFVFRRQVVERASAIAPFLQFLEAPYPVIHEGRVVWILEGFTSTRYFPLSSPQALTPGREVTYLRNSVKITVDGVTGETRFYRIDEDDPLLDAWMGVFPGLFLPLEEMPAGLRPHLRYPRQLLRVQSRVLLQYHLETPAQFHGQQDVWALPQELARGTRPVPYVPEYGHYALPGQSQAEFLLTTVFVPTGRQNLTAILVARCDPENFGDLLLYEIPVEEQVPGPRQVEALVEQDPAISQQFALWRQGGSQVWSGHLHAVPVGRTLLYMEPIFLAAEADAIPELQRFVISDGHRVAMEESLGDAIATLALSSGRAAPVSPSSGSDAPPPDTPLDRALWPQEALDLLDRAESLLREGDWSGFGEALAELRAYLRGLSRGEGEG